MNNHYEENRLTFVFERDGLDSAIAFAKQLVHVYTATVRGYKMKRIYNHPYREAYTESAYSARFLLRTKFLENLAAKESQR